MFTGSGIPMRFADLDGSLIDVYQATTQITDESDMNIPAHIAALLDRALGPQGYYGVFTMNMHTDRPVTLGADAIVAAAQARGVPVISAEQMLDWLEGRNNSSFAGLASTAAACASRSTRPPALEASRRWCRPSRPAGGWRADPRRRRPCHLVAGRQGNRVPGLPSRAGQLRGQLSGRIGSFGGGGTAAPRWRGAAARRDAGGRQPGAPGAGAPHAGPGLAPRFDQAAGALSGGRAALPRRPARPPRRGDGGTQEVRVAGGTTRLVSLRLSKRTRRRLAHVRSLRAVVLATARDSAANRATTTTPIRLLAPRRR